MGFCFGSGWCEKKGGTGEQGKEAKGNEAKSEGRKGARRGVERGGSGVLLSPPASRNGRNYREVQGTKDVDTRWSGSAEGV